MPPFRGPDVERLVEGRERIYLDRFWNELSANPKSIDEPTRQHYAALYARPGAMHSAFSQFAAFSQDAVDNKAFAEKSKLTMPVLAICADRYLGSLWPTTCVPLRTCNVAGHFQLWALADGRAAGCHHGSHPRIPGQGVRSKSALPIEPLPSRRSFTGS
jgi:hypothetical protein